jgi:hypothetical protein
MKRFVILTLLALQIGSAASLPTLGAGAAAASCAGDCSDDRAVSIDELLTMVNIALGTDVVANCSAGDVDQDDQITIDEIILAVDAALGGCPLEGSGGLEAASGVDDSTRDARDALAIIDFGTVGASGSGGSESFSSVPSPTLTFPDCRDGGKLDVMSCDVSQGTSVLSAVFSNCRDVVSPTRTVVRDGKIQQSVTDPDFCSSGRFSAAATVTLRLRDFTAIASGPDGDTVTQAGTLISILAPSGQGCAGTEGFQSVEGGLRVARASDGKDVSYMYLGVTRLRQSVPALSPCTRRDTVNGTLSVDDRARERHFSETMDLVITSQQTDNLTVVSVEGRLAVDCLGAAHIKTTTPLRLASGGGCPLSGALQVTLGDGTVGTIFYSANGLGFDYDGDGKPDASFVGCRSKQLTECNGP